MAATLRTSALITVKIVCQKRAGSLLTRRRPRYVCVIANAVSAAGEDVSFLAADFHGYSNDE